VTRTDDYRGKGDEKRLTAALRECSVGSTLIYDNQCPLVAMISAAGGMCGRSSSSPPARISMRAHACPAPLPRSHEYWHPLLREHSLPEDTGRGPYARWSVPHRRWKMCGSSLNSRIFHRAYGDHCRFASCPAIRERALQAL
jgi:hypothetical protein